MSSYYSSVDEERRLRRQIISGTLGIICGGLGAFVFSRYRVCYPNQYLVKTGLGIKDMTVCKKGFVWPFQKMQIINMNPRSYSFELHHMSREKVPFNLPVVFTIAPTSPDVDMEFFKSYARKMTNITEEEMETTIKSVIHGETRILSAELTIEEMFSDKDKFKTAVSDNIQRDLNQFGLQICNANIEEMKDLDDNKYFNFRKQKAIEGANNEARVEVAEARKIGDIGEQERQAETRQRRAQIEAETVKIENTRDRDIAESARDLSVSKSQFSQAQEIARIESLMSAKNRLVEMEQLVEAKRVQQELETLRATDLVQAKVTAESRIESAEGEAEAQRRLANANLYSELKKSEGLQAIAEAQAVGMAKMLEASGNNPQLLQFYLASNSGLYVELADKTAKAIQGLQPKINIWNTGSNANDDPFGSLRGLMSSLPPMLDVLKSQTDVPFLGKDKSY